MLIKTRQENALGQVFKGIVEGRKSPKHDLYRGTDGYYVNEMLITAPCQRQDSNHILYGIVGLNYAWIKRSVTELDTSIDKEYDMFCSFYFIMQDKLIILRTRYFLHQNTSQLQWLKEKKITPK